MHILFVDDVPFMKGFLFWDKFQRLPIPSGLVGPRGRQLKTCKESEKLLGFHCHDRDGLSIPPVSCPKWHRVALVAASQSGNFVVAVLVNAKRPCLIFLFHL